MNIVSTNDMRLLDQIAIEQYHIPSLQLMSNAAQQLGEWIELHYKKDAHILIVCGPGNNGGDGFALAILLNEKQYKNIQVVCNVEEDNMSNDERFYAQKAKKLHIPVMNQYENDCFKRVCQHQNLLVDALFGNGCYRAITGIYEMLVSCMNESTIPILSVDIASGIHSDTGQIMHCAIKAHTTITFTCATMGHMIYPGSEYSGRLLIKPIGIPEEILQSMEGYPMIEHAMVRAYLPKRYAHSHKGSYGKALLIGGSTSMHGAITLCAKSMLRSGVGMLTLFIPNTITTILSLKMEECMILESESSNGYFSDSSVKQLKECIKAYDTLVIGNGMGRSKNGEELVKTVLESELPCVIDGDAIFAISHQLHRLKEHKAPIIITPHPKEMSYLTGKSVKDIMENPFHVVKEFAALYHVVVVLKDQYTYISDGQHVYVYTGGNHALAKGGSGDVLCGIISGLFAQSKNALYASICGVYVHGECANRRQQKEDGNSILPSDLLCELSMIYRSLR